MMSRWRPPDSIVTRSVALLQDALEPCHPRDFAIRLWDGTMLDADPGRHRRFTLVLRHPGALSRMFWRANEVTLGEAYLHDDFDIEGDVSALFALADFLLQRPMSFGAKLRFAKTLLTLPSDGRPRVGRQAARLSGDVHSKERDRLAVSYHYDVPSEFFALWLDHLMVYSCAYFASPADSLERAQEQKLDYICRKLRLRPGERILDLGCGWGGLMMHAARNYGVKAVGITLSAKQANLANERIAQAGLAERCVAKTLDYRDLDEPDSYDKLVSIGMFEHVGERMLPEFFRRGWTLLRPGGVFLNHGIAFSAPQPPSRGPTFFHHYVFPDGELVPLSTTLRAAETSGFEVRDVESLREHYVLTLRHWISRLETAHHDAQRLTDEVTYRIWRLYMGAAVHQFVTGRATLYQVLLSKTVRGAAELPLTRADWYVGDPRREA
jgi:cyclopropane-fatty-acyl-phospholipid synthase